MDHAIWPLFDLEVRTPRLTLRYVDDELAVQLADLAGRGVHDPATTPFTLPWTDDESPDLERNCLRYYWRTRAETRPESWELPLAVLVDDVVVGGCSISVADFSILKQFETGSWLGLEHQGIGLGKELRRANLALGFIGFGADLAVTAAWHDNAASLGVTRSLGYEREGRRRTKRRDDCDELVGFRMAREHFETLATDDIELVRIEAAREFLEISG